MIDATVTTPSLPRRLANDNRGAVMMTGLFMSFFLVGSLWFVIGIGNAVIFRDRMQEAADHAAFSSAALHAKGMNFISAMNLIMLVMVIVHIVLGIIHDFALAACILTLGTGCGGWVTARNVYTTYSNFMKPILTGIHIGEMVAGYGYPWLGTLKGYQIGTNYGGKGPVSELNVIALSESNIPGAALGAANHGLPVGPKPMDFLCEKVVGQVWDFGKRIAGDKLDLVAQIFDTFSNWLGFETIGSIVEGLLRNGVKLRYCNSLGTTNADFRRQFSRGQEKVHEENEKDQEENGGQNQRPIPNMATSVNGQWRSGLDPGFDPGWGQDGPMVVNDGVKNGSRQMWVFAVNFGPKYKEDSEKRVTLAKGPTTKHGGLVGQVKDEQAMGYIAQAEFYFDCKGGWGGDDCNGEDNDMNSTFAIRWKARLRRLQIPNLGELLANFALDRILNSEAYTSATGAIEDTIRGLGSGPLAALGAGLLADWVNEQIASLEAALRETVVDGASNFNPLPQSYH